MQGKNTLRRLGRFATPRGMESVAPPSRRHAGRMPALPKFSGQFAGLIAIAIAVVFVLAVSGSTAVAQSFSSLRGLVTDSSGAVVPGAQVTLTLASTALKRTTATSARGAYEFLQLQPGTYRLEVSAPGFAEAVRSNLELLVNLPATVNVTLALATATQTIQVEASVAPLINTVNASQGEAFNEVQVSQLPIEARNVVSLLSLQPGVTYLGDRVDANSDTRSGAVNGVRSDQSNVTLDGVDVNDQNNGYAFTSVLHITPDSVQEFRVTTGNAGADAGHSAGAQVALVTKSGTNQLHGSLYEYNRDTAFSANDFFLNKTGTPRPALIRNVYGGSVGGPIRRDRIFYFFNYEGRRDRQAASVVRTVPTESFRNGIVSYNTDSGSTVSLTPAEIKAMDPLGIGINPAVMNVLQGYPLPNDSSVGDGLNKEGYRFGTAVANRYDTYITRFDWHITADGRQTMFWRGNLQRDNLGSAPQFPGQPPASEALDDSRGFALGYTSILKPTVVNTFRWGLTRQSGEYTGDSLRPDSTIAGVSDPVSFSRGTQYIIPVHNFVDDLSWIKGSHTLQFGANVDVVHDSRVSYANSFSSAHMTAGWLVNSGIANKGGYLDPPVYGYPAVAGSFDNNYDNSMMAALGLVTEEDAIYNYGITGAPLPLGAPTRRAYALNEYEFFAQDAWKLKPSLTVTYGLRWTLLQPPYEMHGVQVGPCVIQGSTCAPYSLGNWFDQRAQLMAQGLPSSQAPEISFAPSGPMNNRPTFWNYDDRNFGPRVGAAWSPSASGGLLGKIFGQKGDFVIRGGYSLMFDHFGAATVNTYDASGSYGLTSNVSNVPDAVNAATAPRFTGIYNIPAGLLPPPPPGGFPATPSPSAFAITWGMDGNLKTPYTHDLDLSIGRQLTNNSSLEVSYIGTFGRRLLMQEDMAMPLNLVDPKSKMDYFTAVNLLDAQARAGVPAQNVAPIAYWQDMFPALAGEDIGFGPNTTATQVAYNVFSQNLTNETSGLFALDLPDSETGAGLNVPGHSYPPFRYYDNQYSSLYAWRSIGQSSYNGLQVVYRRRMGHGLQADFNYTYSKSMDWASGAERIPTSGGNNYAQIINSWSPAQLRGVSDFDVTHQVNSNWIWLMPFGRGRRFGAHSNAVLDAIFGGWQLAGLVRWTTGFPMSVSNGSTWPTNWNIEGFGTLANNIPASALGNGPGPNAFKNPGAVFGAFRQAYPGESGTRNPLRGDGFFDLDTGLDKYFSLGGDRKLEFRWETFNAPNSVRFDVMTAGNRLDDLAAFGKYTSELTDPRVMQFALRIDF